MEFVERDEAMRLCQENGIDYRDLRNDDRIRLDDGSILIVKNGLIWRKTCEL